MPEIKYLCFFDEWSGFMDGHIIIGELHFNYDFVEYEDTLGDFDHQITPFTEDAARQHFADHGIPNITFIYN
jgi:hypothetical protein